jgi:hypothetical protein
MRPLVRGTSETCRTAAEAHPLVLIDNRIVLFPPYGHFRSLQSANRVANELRDSFTEDSLINSPRFGGAFLWLWLCQPIVGYRNPMPDRNENLRREAARCLEAAKNSKDPNSRAELIRLAQKFLELAGHQPSVDLDAILDEYNAQQMTGRPGDAQPVAHVNALRR